MRRKLILSTLIFFIAYVASYWFIRESYTVRYEKDGCPTRGCEEVRFPGDGGYMIYAPLYLLEKYMDSETDFMIIRK